MGDILKLGSPIASGGEKLVFEHPTHPDQLVKTFKAPFRVREWPIWTRPMKRRFGQFREWHVEYLHYIALMARTGQCPDYIPRFFGFTETSEGLGQLVERIGSKNGLAATLREYLKEDVPDPDLRPALIKLFDDLKRDEAIFRDLGPQNICLHRDDAGKLLRLVIVDGFGDATLVPIRRFSKHAYDRWHRNARTRLLRAIDKMNASPRA